MKKLTWTWKKIVNIILGLLGIGTLTSCYGVVAPIFPKDIQGQVTGDIDGDGKEEPVPEIEICCTGDFEHLYIYKAVDEDSEHRKSYTDKEGFFYESFVFDSDTELSFAVTLTDIDGKQNGSFKTKTIPVKMSFEEDFLDLGEIVLEPADDETSNNNASPESCATNER